MYERFFLQIMSILRNDYVSNLSSYMKNKGYDIYVICKSRAKPEEAPISAGTMASSDAEVRHNSQIASEFNVKFTWNNCEKIVEILSIARS